MLGFAQSHLSWERQDHVAWEQMLTVESVEHAPKPSQDGAWECLRFSLGGSKPNLTFQLSFTVSTLQIRDCCVQLGLWELMVVLVLKT